MSFDLRVGNTSLAFTHTCECLKLACDIASDVSHSHSFVNLHLSGAVLEQLQEKRSKEMPNSSRRMPLGVIK